MVIEVYPSNIPADIESYYDIPLCLDKDLVDLRRHVYDNFMIQLSHERDFWDNLILNTKPNPTFTDRERVKEALKLGIEEFGYNLLPRQEKAALNSITAEDYYLIQGPPGTGKSFVLSIIIMIELAILNNKVVIIGPNHMAINNTLIQVVKNFPYLYPIVYKVGQSYNAPNYKVNTDGLTQEIKDCLESHGEELYLKNIPWLNTSYVNQSEHPIAIGMTSHSLYTKRASGLECDTLIVDEAGQMTIPLALMGMIKAKKIIFAGDYKQLPPIVSSDKIRNEMKQSVFQALISNTNCTMLDVSFRMCEPICNFVSELFYDGELKPMKPGCGDTIINTNPLYSFDTPIVIQHIDDCGEQTSDMEAEFIAEIIKNYLNQGLPASEIAVLSPFRAQAANIRRVIHKNEYVYEENRILLAIDTVDKMQGQEREVIIFSLTAGNIEYMTEMADFLYNPNKLNVAFSRAKSKLIIVGNINNLEHIDFEMFPHIKNMLNSQYVKMI
jgi:superfamily I DNA and/or RNA helicase